MQTSVNQEHGPDRGTVGETQAPTGSETTPRRARGKLDLSETFIDASFSSAKKGALLSARLAAEKAVKSWRSQTAMVFLSPAASPALRRMKPSSSKLPSSSASRKRSQNE